jgi:hypothetical protein
VCVKSKDVGEERNVWAMVFPCGGEEFGLFKAPFSVEATPEKSYLTGYNGIVYDWWTVMHVASGRLICAHSSKTPQEAKLFFKQMRVANFGKGKEGRKRFAEAVIARNEYLTKEGR